MRCRRGECFSDAECPAHLACFDYRCKDPCKGPDTSCGDNANCKVDIYIIYIMYYLIISTFNEGCEPRVRVLVSRRLPGQPRYSVCSLETETELLLLNNPVIRKYVIIDFIRTFR